MALDMEAQMSDLAGVMQIVDDLTDAFERVAHEFPTAEVIPLHGTKAAAPSLSECVPLLAIALELVDRGPAALTVEAVETYRENAKRLLQHLRPAIEREARMTIEDWASAFRNRAEMRAAA